MVTSDKNEAIYFAPLLCTPSSIHYNSRGASRRLIILLVAKFHSALSGGIEGSSPVYQGLSSEKDRDCKVWITLSAILTAW